MFSRRPTSNGGSSFVPNSIRPPTYSRQQHLDSYLNDASLGPSTQKVSRDDSTYDTVFQSVDGNTLILRVHWPNSDMQPSMILAGVEAEHAWIDTRMRVTGYAPIQSADAWRSSNLILGKAVLAVIQHMQLNPPNIVRFTDAGLIAAQKNGAGQKSSSSSGNSSNGFSSWFSGNQNGKKASPPSTSTPPPPSYNTVPQPPPPPSIRLPSIPTQFPELNKCSREQLQGILTDELELRAFCNRLHIMQELHDLQKEKLLANAATAEKRCESEAEIKELQSSVKSLQSTLQEKISTFQDLEKEQDIICKPPPMRDVRRKLNSAKKEAFEESEKLAEEWTGENPEAFLSSFLEARKVHHLRAAKLEVLEQQSGSRR